MGYFAISSSYTRLYLQGYSSYTRLYLAGFPIRLSCLRGVGFLENTEDSLFTSKQCFWGFDFSVLLEPGGAACCFITTWCIYKRSWTGLIHCRRRLKKTFLSYLMVSDQPLWSPKQHHFYLLVISACRNAVRLLWGAERGMPKKTDLLLYWKSCGFDNSL